MTKLRECPFCGGRAKTKLPYVRCTECGAQMCYGDDDNDPESAIAAWNRRADDRFVVTEAGRKAVGGGE